MESALRPRDIQARIRAGESVEHVAEVAGVPVERIDAFAAPVIAEREHVAGLALAGPVRRRGESASNRPLRTATTEQLVSRGVDPDDVTWDAFLLGARRWRVRATFELAGEPHEALFVYDQNGRFSVADSDDARWMIGESGTDERPTRAAEADDELALVRAISDNPAAFDGEDDVDDAWAEAALTEVDGVYDLVPAENPELDALYDMLASFDEDSVKIYAGLVRPEGPVIADDSTARSADTPDLPEGARVEPLYVPEDVLATRRATPEPDAAAPEPDAEPEPVSEAMAPEVAPQAAEPPEPEQPPLVEEEPAPTQPRRKPRSKRASVPSWDEIMFGSPRQGPSKR